MIFCGVCSAEEKLCECGARAFPFTVHLPDGSCASIDATALDPYAELESRLHEAGRVHWRELHTKQNASPKWFADWLTRVPSYGCNCRRDFEKLLGSDPPDYADWFAWTVRIHNSVNEKLGKPIVTLEEAREIWKNQPNSCSFQPK